MESLRLIKKNRKYIAELFNKVDVDMKNEYRNFNINMAYFTKAINDLDYDNRSDDEIMKIKGDIWEIFGELFLTYFKAHFDYNNYRLLEDFDDYGVDATATNVNGDKTVIQYKYRSHPSHKSGLKYADIAKTYAQGVYNLGYELKNKGTIVLFTNLSEKFISREIENFFGEAYLCFNESIIDTYVQNKIPFWDKVITMLEETGVFDGE